MKKAVSLFLSIIAAASMTTTSSSAWKSAVCRVDAEEKVAALTFDDGPHPEYTPEILDILNEYGVKATFFVIGKNAVENPEIIRREFREGHEIENHTFSHYFISKISAEDARSEVASCEDALKDLAECKTRYIRPPGGLYADSFVKLAESMSYKIVLWSVDTKDWRCPTSDSIVSSVISNVTAGDIILMHDYVSGRSSTPEALRRIIPDLLSKGYRFVTVSELIELGGE